MVRSRAERARFKRQVGWHALALRPLLATLSRLKKFDFPSGSIRYEGFAGPKGACSAESFARAHRYQPADEDLFVVTQMRCGTTWMQHLAMQVLSRGTADLVRDDVALYALSPWLEGLKSVSIENAPRVGAERPRRVIKTHLPAQLCPFSERSRYLYVARHPLMCFGSARDFVTANLGSFAPDAAAF